MPLLHCDDCHHEWEGSATDRCKWCFAGSHVIMEKTGLEQMIADPENWKRIIRNMLRHRERDV